MRTMKNIDFYDIVATILIIIMIAISIYFACKYPSLYLLPASVVAPSCMWFECMFNKIRNSKSDKNI